MKIYSLFTYIFLTYTDIICCLNFYDDQNWFREEDFHVIKYYDLT